MVKRSEEEASESELSAAESEMSSAHARLRDYRTALLLAHADTAATAVLRDQLVSDPDVGMVNGLIGEFLVPTTPKVVRDLLADIHPEDRFVRKRLSELIKFDLLSQQAYVAEPAAVLDGCSGWLEEELALRSESPAVLTFLAERAKRKRARHTSRERLAGRVAERAELPEDRSVPPWTSPRSG